MPGRGYLHLLGEYSLGLLDDHPAGERDLELSGDDFLLAGGASLQDPDGGHIDQRTGRPGQRRIQAVRCGAQVERAARRTSAPGAHPRSLPRCQSSAGRRLEIPSQDGHIVASGNVTYPQSGWRKSAPKFLTVTITRIGTGIPS